MPITRRQFELGVDATILELMRKIHDFLSVRRQQAFDEAELIVEVGGPGPKGGKLSGAIVQPAHEDFKLSLNKLAEVGAVEARTVKGTVYYSYRGPLDV